MPKKDFEKFFWEVWTCPLCQEDIAVGKECPKCHISQEEAVDISEALDEFEDDSDTWGVIKSFFKCPSCGNIVADGEDCQYCGELWKNFFQEH